MYQGNLLPCGVFIIGVVPAAPDSSHADIVIGMRRALICVIAALGATVGPAAAAATAATQTNKAPSARRIRNAVSHAKHSQDLWATVNVCTVKRKGGVMGVRGQMPSLGFSATLSMTVHLQQWSAARKAFVRVPGATATHTTHLGVVSSGLHQGGAVFPFTADPGRLNATVTFTWTRAGKVIGRTTRTTTGGHPSANYGRPAHHSAASCTIG